MPYKTKADQDARNRRYYEAHKEQIKAYSKRWFLENEERRKKEIKAWREKNKSKCRRYSRRWKKRHKEQFLASERRRKRAKRMREKGLLEAKRTPAQVAAKLKAIADAKAIQAPYGIQRVAYT